MRWIKYSLLALLLFVIILLVKAPASLLESKLQPALSEQLSGKAQTQVEGVEFYGFSGTLWSGALEQVQLTKGNLAGQSIKAIAWQLSASQLLLGKADLALAIADPKFDGELQLAINLTDESFELNQLNAKQAVAELAKSDPLLSYLQPTGDILWRAVSATVQDEQFTAASGELEWQNASLVINNSLLNLGNVVGTLSADAGDLLVSFDNQGQLAIDGALRIKPSGEYQLELTLANRLPAAIAQQAQYFLRPSANGRLRISRQGRL